MVGGKTARIGVVLDAVETDRRGVDDECAEDTTSGRKRPDGLDQFARHPYMDEFDEGAVLADDPEGRILRPGGLTCRFGRRCQQFGQVSGGGDGGSTCNQCRQSLCSYFGQTSRVVRSPRVALSVSSLAMSQNMRILLVDDHEIVRKGLRVLLDAEPDLEVVGEAGTVADALRRVGFDSPDVVVLDVRLPDGSGIEACRDIRSSFPDVKVLMLTSFADEEALMSAILAGASGYLLKRINSLALIDSLRRIGQGESLIDQEMVAKLFSALRGGRSSDPLLDKLSDQERKVLDLITEGMTNRQISEQMFLAEKTVKNYVSNLLTKLGMSRRSEAAAYAARATATKPDTDREDWND